MSSDEIAARLAERGYTTVETSERVRHLGPDLVTRWYPRAQRRAARLNLQRIFPSYRWEVQRHPDGRWQVVAMQNRAERRR